MKKLSIIAAFVLVAGIWGCTDVRRDPGRVYMPDMAYSRAYETYASTQTLDSHGISYTRQPVPGTIKRGEYFSFTIPRDVTGDSTNYVASRQVANPMPALNERQMVEAERLYLVNCGICHGSALDGNGPLYKGGAGPYAAAPRNLVADPVVTTMPDGQMFYSITYGKGQMGPYGGQLSTTQRWMIVHYINAKQGQSVGGVVPAAAVQGGPAPGGQNQPADTTAATTNNN